MTTPLSRHISTSTLSAARRLAITTAVAASTATLGGCSLLGLSGAPEDKTELARVEETIARARGTGDTTSRSEDYAKNIDAALTKQPALAAKIENIKAGRDPSAALQRTPVETKAVETSDKAAAPKAASAVPVDKVADKTPAKAEPVVATAKTEVAAVPAKIEPAATQVKVESKATVPAAQAVVPPAATMPAAEAKADRPTAMGNVVAVASIDTAAKGTTAMGSMNATGAVPASAVDSAVADPAAEVVSIDSMVGQLRKSVAANPRALNLALALQLLEAETKNSQPDSTFAALTEADQKIVADVASAVDSIMHQPAGSSPSLADRAAPLLAAGHKWESEGDLQLPRLVLASRVDSYGVFSQVEPKFENGKRHTVIIYCEVANFATRKSDDGWYTTKLAQQDSLITEDGLLVWRPNPEEVEDRSRNQRRDFYLVKKLNLPETLAIGKYTLRMSVTDKQTNKISMVSIPVEIVTK